MIVGSLRKGSRPARRRGFGLVEMAATGVMAMAAMAVAVQLLGWAAVERRAVSRRERAILEASNLMERLAARPWDELTPDAARGLTLSDAARAALPGASLTVDVAEAGATPAAKKITVAILWRDRAGRSEAPARLVAWVHQRGGSR